ncbi:branched-chain amino acid aminotransferase [Pedobacter deserti]|uniref:branched-chain amino acid aminotransferase n=1 Tax=Pedobacter deserti TaxID=2817382 RepID=UPI00210A0DAA|nr:branched-chain amino acid aminotransferase [Pedobacter sp. SYSU D00382]
MNTIIDQQPQNGAPAFNFDSFTFGETPTDHMFVAAYRNGDWGAAGLKPFSNFSLSPFSLCFHYGQMVFEGMKAFRHVDGRISIFRPEKHFSRLNVSLERMCMPRLPWELFAGGLTGLLEADSGWMPEGRDDLAMYIRPFVIASQPKLGVKVSDEYMFAIVCTPIGEYYDKPLRVKVETEFVRSAQGGAGYAKCAGNYGAAFYPTSQAMKQGFDQIIWTDAINHEYLEEAGTMNIMLIAGDTLITPPLSNSILDGITRDSLLQIARDMNLSVEERPVSHQELRMLLEAGEQVELFGAGTAAIVSPISCIQINGVDYYPYAQGDAMMFRLKESLEGVRRGKSEDVHHWNYFID